MTNEMLYTICNSLALLKPQSLKLDKTRTTMLVIGLGNFTKSFYAFEDVLIGIGLEQYLNYDGAISADSEINMQDIPENKLKELKLLLL